MNKQLQQTIQTLIESQPNDQRLRDHLEGLRRTPDFPSLTWYWGPILYTRNRVVFRTVIQGEFSDWSRTGLRWKRIAWSEHAEGLQKWLDAARSHRDTPLVRRLLRWKYGKSNAWGLDLAAWNEALLNDYRRANSPAARVCVLDEYDDWFHLDEATAVSLYRLDRATHAFILKHLPQTFWSGDKRQLWGQLAELAKQSNDEKLYFELYRRQLPLKEWSRDALQLARALQDPAELCSALEQRHPSGYGLDVAGTLLQLLDVRGRDVIPYVRGKLNNVRRGWVINALKPFVDLAAQRGWWDLWSTAIRSSHDDRLFNSAVKQLVTTDTSLSDVERLSRLRALVGVSREWSGPGFGLARVHALKDEQAVLLYQRYPDLVRGPFRPHVAPTWWQNYPRLLAVALAAEDEELVDLLASRYVTRANLQGLAGKSEEDAHKTANSLGDYYQSLRARDPVQFAQRAANVLTRLPSYSIYNVNLLIETNKLARLLFVRSMADYLAEPAAIRDLVEGSEIHVQMLAYRILAQDDPRARQLAVDSLDILIGTLLRPLHRKTRLAAFNALFNAAMEDQASAELILRRGREAFRLPDRKYPKEQLVGMLGQILHRYPQFCSERERPLIYGLSEVTA